MTASRPKDPLMKRLMRWLVPDQRMANRHLMPPLTAYLGMVRTSKEYKVADVSVAGFYMLTDERWIPGTGFPVTLERTDQGQSRTLTLYATVVRTGEDGVGFSFLNPAEEEQQNGDNARRVDLTQVAQFLKGLQLSDPDSLERAS
ncbi:MAG TPA: PilZ domain-containing protein [Terracidiphilus sp.]